MSLNIKSNMWKLRELYETRPNFCVPSYILSLHLFPVIKSKTLLALKSNTLGPAFKLKQSLFLSSASHFVNLEHHSSPRVLPKTSLF